MSTSTPLSFLHSLPDAADIDVSEIKGNVSDNEKRLGANIFAYFVNGREESYGAQVGRRLRLVEMNIWGKDAKGAAAQGQTVFEIDVLPDMCNVYGTLHGACAAYIVDPCSVSSLVVLGAAIGADGTGISQSLNMIWHQPAKMGTKLRVLSNSVYIHGRIRTARCEIWDREKDKLYVSAVHSTVNNTRPKL
ncbi:hypothetical protein BDZ89DRAFT_488586 [Hymenopellis radicata]|nr:hypothetical protein BDZ89DRAFT_488586 [Hymenopellis radicata]